MGEPGSMTSKASTRAARLPGRLHDQRRAPACRRPHATACRSRGRRGSLALADRLGEPGRLALDPARVPSGVRSRGPKPVPPVVMISPAKPSVSSRSASRDRLDAVGDDAMLVDRRSPPRSSAPRAPPDPSSRVPATTPSETVSTLARDALTRVLAAARIAAAAAARIVGAEDAGARNEDVDAGLRRELRVVDLDAAVDLDLDRRGRARRSLARGAHLVEHLGDERLTAEAGVHAHHEQRVDVVEVRLDRVERRLAART